MAPQEGIVREDFALVPGLLMSEVKAGVAP